MNHITEAVKRGLAPSGCVRTEAEHYWQDMDEVERFRVGRDLGISSKGVFIDECEKVAGETRLRRASEDCYLAAFYGRK